MHADFIGYTNIIFGIAKGMNGVPIEGFTIHAYTCVYMYSLGGVLGINLTEVSTMLSQGEDFTQLNTTQLGQSAS